MSNILSHRQPTGEDPALVTMYVRLDRVLRAQNRHCLIFSFHFWEVKPHNRWQKSTIQYPYRCSIVLRPKSSFTKIGETDAVTQSDGQTGNEEIQKDKEQGYHPYIFKLFQGEIAFSGVQRGTRIQSIIVHKSVGYYTEHLFLIPCKKMKPAIKTCLGPASLRTSKQFAPS